MLDWKLSSVTSCRIYGKHNPFCFSPPFFTARFGLRDYGRRVRSDLQKNGGMEKQTVRVVISTWMLLSSRMAYWGASRVMQGRQLKRLG